MQSRTCKIGPPSTGMCSTVVYEVLHFEFKSLAEKRSCKDWSVVELTVIFMDRLMLPKIKQKKKKSEIFIFLLENKFSYGHRKTESFFSNNYIHTKIWKYIRYKI